MANTTFSGPVRSEGGFTTISKNASTGTITTQSSINYSGFASLEANKLTTDEISSTLPILFRGILF